LEEDICVLRARNITAGGGGGARMAIKGRKEINKDLRALTAHLSCALPF
jgi:hypothetical protein